MNRIKKAKCTNKYRKRTGQHNAHGTSPPSGVQTIYHNSVSVI